MKKNIKIIFYLFSPLFLLLSLNNSNIFASDISDCLEIKRKEAQSEGATFSESTDYAREICNAKFNKKSSFLSDTKNQIFSQNADIKESGFFVSASPVLVGSTKIKTTISQDEKEYCDYGSCVTTGGTSQSSEVDFSLGAGSRAGYSFKAFRVYLTSYTLAKFLDIDFKINKIFAGGGIAVSGVLGNEVDGFSAHAGYIHSFSENLGVEGVLFFARATHEKEIAPETEFTGAVKHKLEYSIGGLSIYLTYVF